MVDLIDAAINAGYKDIMKRMNGRLYVNDDIFYKYLESKKIKKLEGTFTEMKIQEKKE